MTRLPFTVRVTEDSAVASLDDGRSRPLSTAEADAVAAIVLTDRKEFTFTESPAAARASLAEAHEAAPRPGFAPPESRRSANGVEIALAPHARPVNRSFGDVLSSRRSLRQFAPLSLNDLATVLVSAGRIVGWTDADDGSQMTLRPAPSAGARHPYELAVAVADVAGLTPGLWLFDPVRCTIARHSADGSHRAALNRVAAALAITDAAPATVFVVGSMRQTLSRYPAGSTLVWRDAGAVLATLHLAATAASLASCIVGTAGVLACDEENLVADLGALALGRPQSP